MSHESSIFELVQEIGARSMLYGNTVLNPGVFLGSTYKEVKDLYDWGHIDERTWRRFRFAWGWSDFRFGGDFGPKHEAYWTKFGKEAYYRRVNRVRKVLGLKTFNPPE